MACSLWPTDPVYRYFWTYPDQPPMLRVSTLYSGLWLNIPPSSTWVISKPVSITTSASVGEAVPWPKMKALKVSDQKYEAVINIDSLFSISAMESLIHWSSLRSPQYTSFVLLTLRNQSFHPLVGFCQDRKVSFHKCKEKFSALKGILLVSALIRSAGSGSPIGPRHWRWGCSVGITIFSLRSWSLEIKRTGKNGEKMWSK